MYQKLIEDDKTVSAKIIKDTLLKYQTNTSSLVKAFEQHNTLLKERVGIDYSPSTYKRYETTLDHIKNFKKVIFLAIKKEWLDKYPFVNFIVKPEETKRVSLSQEELD
ncbi:hypothetical protein DF185_09280 [Marinifilum breve]|uniref:Phage integrase SAM-like domain-containing protein n=1 Tax=Marinifilum breve TaxID=2184082 RepID=A0A2V3ZZS9_9BACT|nr:hypothetical protein DF185_09280 [Marinifilum breve]